LGVAEPHNPEIKYDNNSPILQKLSTYISLMALSAGKNSI